MEKMLGKEKNSSGNINNDDGSEHWRLKNNLINELIILLIELAVLIDVDEKLGNKVKEIR